MRCSDTQGEDRHRAGERRVGPRGRYPASVGREHDGRAATCGGQARGRREGQLPGDGEDGQHGGSEWGDPGGATPPLAHRRLARADPADEVRAGECDHRGHRGDQWRRDAAGEPESGRDDRDPAQRGPGEDP
ncbi:MAG: hypothetical protein WEB09_08270 [Nitriliruptor sp.]